MSPLDHPLIRRFIEEAGNTTQTIGVGRAIGQIYAYLYFSEQPRSLDDIKDALGISKGSASMGVRQLEMWGAAQRVWVKGDRKDYYSASDYFGRVLRNMALDVMGKRIEALSHALDTAEAELSGKAEKAEDTGGNGDKFLRARIQRLRQFQKKAQSVWNNPLVKMMMQ